VAKQDLKKLLVRVEAAIEKDSTVYRKLVSDKKAHSISISLQKVTTQVKREMESRIGVKKGKLQKTIIDVIDVEVPKMVSGIYNDIKAFNTDGKFSEVSQLVGNPSGKFTFVLAAKKGKTTSIFNAFRNVKQANQKVLLKKLRAAIKKLNSGRGDDNKIKQIGKNFLDIGHEDGSAVSTQRAAAAQKALYTFGMNEESNPVISNFLKEISDELTLSLTKRDSKGPKDTIHAELESKYLNRKRGGGVEKALAKELTADLKRIMEKFNASEWANLKGSDSKVDKVRKTVLNTFAGLAKKNGNIKSTIKKQSIKPSQPVPVKGKTRKVKAVQGSKQPLQTVDSTQALEASNPRSLFSYVAMINKKLPQTVRKNMGPPGFENQTGRFATSVKVQDVNITKQGHPSFGYTYAKNPYQVFEVGEGAPPWANGQRDPRKLIDKSIREVAAELAIGRFYTRRL